MRKVLFIMPSLGSGGAERVVFNLLNGLAPLGLQIHLLLLFSEGFLVSKLPAGVSVQITKHKRLVNGFFTIWKALKSDTDFVFCSGYHNPYVALLAFISGTSHKLILRETSVVGSAKGRWKAVPILSLFMPIIYNSCHCVIFQSFYGKTDFERFFGFRLNRWKVMINPSFGLKMENSNEAKSIFLVGTLNSNKNQKAALNAIQVSGLKEITVEIFGDGPERKELEALVSASKFDFKVLFHGNVSSMDQHWSRAALHVMTSKFESFPNVVIEAASGGVPSVCLDVPGGMKELFELGNWGELVSDTEKLPKAIKQTYYLSLDKRQLIGKIAYDRFHLEAMKNYQSFFLESAFTNEK